MSPEDIETALDLCERLCERFEGFRAKPYLDVAKVPTIGFGTTRYPGGERVQMSDPPVTREQAREYMRDWLRRETLPAVLEYCPSIDTPGRMAAILDFTYNLGAARLETSTLRKKIAAGQWEQVPAQLRKWVFAAGAIQPGLVKRRDAEAEMI
jgi:lysozyme